MNACSDLKETYNNLMLQYYEAHKDKMSFQLAQQNVATLWNSLKSDKNNFPSNVAAEMRQLKESMSQKRVNNLHKYMVSLKTCQKKPDKPPAASEDNVGPQPCSSSTLVSTSAQAVVIDTDEIKTPTVSRQYSTPASDKLETEIVALNQDIVYLQGKKDSGLATELQEKELKDKKARLHSVKNELAKVKSARERQQKKRIREKEILEANPEIAQKLKRRDRNGRPSLETDQPGLLKAIVDIVSHGAPTEDRRRCDMLYSIKTLDGLTDELNRQGFHISRSATYFRLMPKRPNSNSGKRHVNTVPVRLKRAMNDSHKTHSDAKFCQATINNMEEMASVIGGKDVLFISQDDKARVPIGITAAHKQAPILMHMDYKVSLPDHDWVVAERHKLIPSVYALMKIKDSMQGDKHAVTYSGPTYIGIRSGKHCRSNAASHGRDFSDIIQSPDYEDFTQTNSGKTKPVVFFVVDGGPDENPRYEKVISQAIHSFKQYDLDFLTIATNAPGRSAYNRVERRMAPLSKELSGVILDHEHYGSHLDSQGRTVDQDKEMKNFEFAGQTLAKIWSEMSLDGFPVFAEYISPEKSERTELITVSPVWKAAHVRESHYCLQIAKCDDIHCCGQKRSSYRNVFPRFLPAPVCMDEESLTARDNTDAYNKFPGLFIRLQLNDLSLQNHGGTVPYDRCCPSIQELIPSRTCPVCGLYFASVKSMTEHKRVCSRPAPECVFGASALQQRANRRPVRVAARKGRERLTIWTTRLNDIHYDWMDESELVEEVVEETTARTDENPNILDKHYLKNCWEDE